MSNNNLQNNSKTFEQAVDLLANIFVSIIDNKTEEVGPASSHNGLLPGTKSNSYEKENTK